MKPSETWEEVPKPTVVRKCGSCLRGDTVRLLDATHGVVSPSGIEHIGRENGDTACGKDATPDGWWWPL